MLEPGNHRFAAAPVVSAKHAEIDETRIRCNPRNDRSDAGAVAVEIVVLRRIAVSAGNVSFGVRFKGHASDNAAREIRMRAVDATVEDSDDDRCKG